MKAFNLFEDLNKTVLINNNFPWNKFLFPRFSSNAQKWIRPNISHQLILTVLNCIQNLWKNLVIQMVFAFFLKVSGSEQNS